MFASRRVALARSSEGGEGQELALRWGIRGKSQSTVFRMAIALLTVFRRSGSLSTAVAIDHWQEAWKTSLSQYERDFIPENWVTVYQDGEKLFETHPQPEIDRIEAVAGGASINDDILGEAIEEMRQDDVHVHIHNDTQIAAVVNLMPKYIKCALLERQIRADGTFHFTLWYNEEKVPLLVALGAAMQTACNIVEASSMITLYHRTRERLPNARGDDRAAMQRLLDLAKARTKELNSKINVMKSRAAIKFSPEAPNFTIVG